MQPRGQYSLKSSNENTVKVPSRAGPLWADGRAVALHVFDRCGCAGAGVLSPRESPRTGFAVFGSH
jgi:hypothetical protein